MEEIVKKIDELINVVENNGVPVLLTWVGILFPIFISIVVIFQTAIQASRNKKFQKYISDRDIKVQMHTDILKIYDDFCVAQNSLTMIKGRIHIIFSDFYTQQNGQLIPVSTIETLISSLNKIVQARNKAGLIFPDTDKHIHSIIKNINDKYKKLCIDFEDYLNSGVPYQKYLSAWEEMKKFNFQPNSYHVLTSSPAHYQTFLESCKTQTTNDMEKNVDDLLELFRNENFDEYFKKYVQIDSIIGEEKNA